MPGPGSARMLGELRRDIKGLADAQAEMHLDNTNRLDRQDDALKQLDEKLQRTCDRQAKILSVVEGEPYKGVPGIEGRMADLERRTSGVENAQADISDFKLQHETLWQERSSAHKRRTKLVWSVVIGAATAAGGAAWAWIVAKAKGAR